jgi:F-type H+-transporting ATPase subunit b
MEINGSVIFFTVLNVLILYWFLRKKFFTPVLNLMDSRTKSIESQIQNAEEMVKQAQEMKMEYEKKLIESENEGKKIVQEYRDKAINLSNEIVNEANSEAELIKARANKDAEREREKAQEEIRRQVISLALMAASKAVDGQLDNNNQHILIKQFISKVGA